MKKRNKKKILKKMFITGKAVFFDFRFLLKDHLDFFGKTNHPTLTKENPDSKPMELRTNIFFKAYIKNQSEYLQKMSEEFKIEIEHIPIETILKDRDITAELKEIKLLGGFLQDYTDILRQEAIRKYCQMHKIKKAILPEFSEQLSTRALNLLCKSRSVEIAQSCAASFQLEPEIRVGRPLFDTSNKELLFYSRNKSLFGFVFNDSLTFEKNIQKVLAGSNFAKYIAEGSIGMLLEQFVEEVQGEYSSTSATILRTVGKLDLGGQPNVCVKCGHGFDRGKDLASLVKKEKESAEEQAICSGCQIMLNMLDY